MLVPILIAVVIYYLYTFYFIERKKYPPGPLPVPGFGNLLAVGDDFSQNSHIKVQKCRPERFLTPEGGFFKDDRVTPFSIGKQACAGEGIARMELFMFFTTLLQHFSFEPEIEGEPPKLEYTQGLIRGTRPFKCMVHKRST